MIEQESNQARDENDQSENLAQGGGDGESNVEDDIEETPECNQCSDLKKHNESNAKRIRELEERSVHLEELQKSLEAKLEVATKLKESATRDKEMMVMKYAMGEKNLLEQKMSVEQSEKKYKDMVHENEILQRKVQTMSSERTRICQLLDNKTYEHKGAQQEVERIKADLSALETKLKWSQNSLKTEIELHKECQAKLESQTSKLQEVTEQIEQTKCQAQESIKSFQASEDNRAHVLDQRLKEQQAALILLRHEKDDKELQVKSLTSQLEKLQSKQKDILQENNDLSVKVQQLERERLESGQKLSELRACADQQRQDSADLMAKNVQLDQLKLHLKNEQDQLAACKEQMELFKQRNAELEVDMGVCRDREAELLLFTQQLTDKNVRLQSEFTALETKVQQLTCEQVLLKRSIKEQETRCGMLSAQLAQERLVYTEENEQLTKNLSEKSCLCETYKQELADLKGESLVNKRKFELALREVGKELQQCRKRLEHYESLGDTSSSSSSSSLSVGEPGTIPTPPDQVKVIQPDVNLDRQTLIEHIVKLQKISARKSEKLDFLEEHVNTLLGELQKKSRLLQTYILRDQSGTLTSNNMDKNKAQLAKLNGIMASMYNCRVADDKLTLELALDINRKLQAVLEDALLKNIMLQENMDTLGQEIDRLNKLIKPTCT